MTTEVEQSKLNIHVLNQNQYEALPSVSDTELYIVDPQFQGQKFLGTDEEGEIVEKDALQGVQLNGTDLTITNNKVNIPVASTSGFGVSTINSTYGISITSNGELRTSSASADEIQSKANTAKPLVPKTVDIAVREGLGNYDTANKGVWTDAYKEHACETIGATQTEIVDWIES